MKQYSAKETTCIAPSLFAYAQLELLAPQVFSQRLRIRNFLNIRVQ